MENWRDKVNEFLDDLENGRLFEQNYKVTYPCRFKISGKWLNAKICFKTGEIFISNKVVRRCNVCQKYN